MKKIKTINSQTPRDFISFITSDDSLLVNCGKDLGRNANQASNNNIEKVNQVVMMFDSKPRRYFP